MSAPITNPQKHPRFQMALWYAWGQQDAGVGRLADPFEFAKAHAEAAIAYEAVRDFRSSTGPSFLSSVQDAWNDFINAAHTNVVHIDDAR